MREEEETKCCAADGAFPIVGEFQAGCDNRSVFGFVGARLKFASY